jgi:hypothetical protein
MSRVHAKIRWISASTEGALVEKRTNAGQLAWTSKLTRNTAGLVHTSANLAMRVLEGNACARRHLPYAMVSALTRLLIPLTVPNAAMIVELMVSA